MLKIITETLTAVSYTHLDVYKRQVLIAMKNLGYKKEDIEKMLDELHYVFDTVSEKEAENLSLNPFKWEQLGLEKSK